MVGVGCLFGEGVEKKRNAGVEQVEQKGQERETNWRAGNWSYILFAEPIDSSQRARAIKGEELVTSPVGCAIVMGLFG